MGFESVIPVLGALGAGAIQRKWALKDLERQNAYNSPKSQIGRLKEAGLPLATMFGGQGGSTSEQPSNTQIDPTLGTAKGMELHYMNRLQKKQLEMIDEQLNTQKALTEKEWANAFKADLDAKRANLENQYDISTPEFIDQDETGIPGLTPRSNFVTNIKNQRELTRLQPIEKQMQIEIGSLEKQYKGVMTQEAKTRISKLVQDIAQQATTFENEQQMIAWKLRVMKKLNSDTSDFQDVLQIMLSSLIPILR